MEWAKAKGYSMDQKKVKRISWTKTECGIAGYRCAKASTLTEKRDSMIDDGTIDVGREICPIERKTMRLVGEEVCQKTIHEKGRVRSLRDIGMKHLQAMESHGLLRRTQANTMTADHLRRALQRRKGETGPECLVMCLVKNYPILLVYLVYIGVHLKPNSY